jgi:hypothetical protein
VRILCTILSIVFITSYVQLNAQVGRAELTIDTIQMGGQTQETAMKRMEGRDELVASMKALRDSISTEITAKNSGSSTTLREYKKELESLIGKLQSQSADEATLKEGYKVLANVRQQFKRRL